MEELKLGQEVKGSCINCHGRGRKLTLEYNGDNEVICMVCSHISSIENYLNKETLKRR